MVEKTTETVLIASEKEKNKERVVYFDYLRIVAALAVIIVHVASQKFYVTDVNGFAWQTFNFFDSITRWCVPVFVMISGALFLQKDITIKNIYLKYVLKLVTAFCFWSFIYMLFEKGNLITRLTKLIYGHYHMWFVPMIIGVYICIPFIKPIIKDKTITKYFLVLALFFACIMPQFIIIVNDFGTKSMIKIASAFQVLLVKRMNVNIVLGYVGYFILGYYLNKLELKKMHRFVIYFLGIFGAVLTITLNLLVALKTQKYCSNYFDFFCVNVLLESIAVFTIFKYAKLKPNKFVSRLSKYSFGAYLAHPLILENMNSRLGFNTTSLSNPIISVLLITLIVFVGSFIISAILNKIPIVKKYVV